MIKTAGYLHVWALCALILGFSGVVRADEVLSDDEAFSRAQTVCSQKIFPMWRPKEGEKVKKYRKTNAHREIIAECMRDYGVPVIFDPDEWFVRTGTGFGQDVNISIDDLFPESVTNIDTITRENPYEGREAFYEMGSDVPVSEPMSHMAEEKSDRNINKTNGAATLSSPSAPLKPKTEVDKHVAVPHDKAPSTTKSSSSANERKIKPIYIPR